MKVVAINGSPKKNGNTKHALNAMSDIFSGAGIDFEIIDLGNKPVYNCIACGQCDKLDGLCAVKGDIFNDICNIIADADGIIVGAPVYYGGIAGGMKSFMDRFFRTNSQKLEYKPVAALCLLRRSGGVETFNQLSNYFALSRSIIVPTSYWSAFHGGAPGEVINDDEAMDCANEIAINMVWLLNTLAESKIQKPCIPKRRFTNFIR